MNFLIDIFGCSVEIILLYYFYRKLLGNSKYNHFVEIICYIAMGFFLLFLSIISLSPMVRTFLVVLPILFLLCLYKQELKLKLLYGMVYLSIQVMSESFTKSISLLLDINNLGTIGYIEGVTISKTIALFVIILFTRFLHVRNVQFSNYLTFSLLLIPFFSLILIYELRDIIYILNTPINYFKYLLAVILLIASNLILFYLFEKNSELHWVKERMLIQETLLTEQKNYYEKAVSMYQENRQLAHNFKNHLLIINGYVQNNQLSPLANYIGSLTDMIQSTSTICSGHASIDAVLSSKKDAAKQQLTEFNLIEMTLPIATLTAEEDIAIILATSLDNALEATAKISDTSSRWINLLLRHDAAYLYLQIENSTAEPVQILNNTVRTTKSNPDNHGFGLRTIHNLVAEHSGKIKLTHEENVFSLTIMLPIN